MLLIKAGRDNSLQNCALEPCAMNVCLHEAITRYPFRTSTERSLVSCDGDFEFIGSKLLMQHIIFNLLKNSLYAINASQRGEIKIWTSSDYYYNYLHIKDTATGIPPKQVDKLFKPFATTNFTGTGLGLSFCKLVMHHFGGDICCDTKQGSYTTFILSFPLVNVKNISQKYEPVQ
jgi:signal transduction histidine kinase